LRGVYTVRALLMGLQSRLTHNNGERWSLNVRISDGSASLDAEVEDELLRRLIGVSAVEAKAMHQLGRQGDEAQKSRLQSIFSTFQDRLFHLNGLFDILIPDDMDSTPPRLINYRDMDATWLRDMQNRVSDNHT
uniref:RMI1_C domain-containing protein n=2 Tax=Schistocephalus solidus TaxID=70667 RepID=A0A183TCE3_SCHSO